MFGATDDAEAKRTVRDALDAGVNLFDTSPYYGLGLAEERLGEALEGQRESAIVATKAGRYGLSDFNFSPAGIRISVEESLKRLRMDYIDILQLHDIEYVPHQGIFDESFGELLRLREEGKCRFIGVTGYPMKSISRAVQRLPLDVTLNYAHGTLLNTELSDQLVPLCETKDVGLMNAAAVALGLLTPSGMRLPDYPIPPAIRAAADTIRAYCADRNINVAYLANQFAIQRSGCATTVIGTTKPAHLASAVAAVEDPIDEVVLVDVLSISTHVRHSSWVVGIPENN